MPGLGSQSPNNREGLSAVSSITGNNEYVYSTSHALNVTLAGSVGTITTAVQKTSTSTVTRVATSTVSAQLLAANTARIKIVIVNDAVTNLYIKYGTTASATSFTYLLQPYDTLEEYNYTGRIDGILASGTGSAEVNEM